MPSGAHILTRLHAALRALISAASPLTTSLEALSSPDPAVPAPPLQPIDCAVCLNALAPFQALFLAPCSHCYHYKCVRPLLDAQGVMFLCPLCRQVANLEASVSSGDLEAEAGEATEAEVDNEERDLAATGSGSEDDGVARPGLATHLDSSAGGASVSAYNATAYDIANMGSGDGVAGDQQVASPAQLQVRSDSAASYARVAASGARAQSIPVPVKPELGSTSFDPCALEFNEERDTADVGAAW
ncbi:hypothetical protein HDU93_005038 [Gonapodya sp. JEL0774]|nr:hypothetical protein HDU93_005038 [Gonapodya sp. JEL0774]